MRANPWRQHTIRWLTHDVNRFIKETFADVFKAQFLVPGSTVIIDGNGWIFNLLENPQARTIMVCLPPA